MSNPVDGVREVSPAEGAALEARGIVADLSRDNVIVHVGKPAGSITGWVGTIFWQVWVDRADAAGTVHARVDQGEIETWQLDGNLSKDALLDQAKDRLIAQVQAGRAERLNQAKAKQAALAA